MSLAVALGLLAVLVGGAVAVYQITFKSKDGTLVVELDDEADVRLKNGKLEVYDDKGVLKYTLTPSERNTALPPGKYTVRVVGADGVKLDTETFEIEKNGKRSVRVTATGPEGAIARDPKKPEPVPVVPPLALKAATWKPGPAENLLPGLVPRPAVLDGVGRWQIVQTPPAFVQPVPVGWSPDGARVAVVVSGSVRIYDSRTGSLLSVGRWVGDLLPNGADSWHINWSPDSKWVRCAVRNKFRFSGVLVGADGTPAPFSRWQNAPADFGWNPKFPVFACVLPEKPDVLQLIDPSLTKPTEVEVRGVRQAAWSPDGEWLVAVGADNTARLFGRDGKPGPKLVGIVSPDVAPVWAADGRSIAALASAGEVGLWKADGTAAAKTGTHKNGVASLHWKPDGKQLAVLDAAGTVHFWTATGAAVGTADATADLTSFQRAKGDQGFFTYGRFWPAVGNPKFIPLHTPGKEGSAVSPDEKRVARVKLGEITLHDLDAAEVKASAAKIPTLGEVTWDASGRRLAVSGQSGVAVYDATDPTRVVWLGGGPGVNLLTRVAFSANGDRMAVGSDLGRVLVCEPTGKVLRVIPTPAAATPDTGGFLPYAIHDLHWHPDGRHLAVTTGTAAVTVFDTVTGVAVATTGLPAARAGGSAQFSLSDPNRILISHPESSAVWQWKVEREPQQKFAGLGRLTVSPDAKRYLAHQFDEQSAVLVSTDLKDRDSSGTKGYAATQFHPGPSLAWHPDGKHLVVTRLSETRNIQIRSLDGKVVEEIKPDGIDVTWLEWASPTPRGSVLLGRVGIDACVLDLNAKTLTPIAKVPGEVSVSPGGEHLIGVDGASLTYWNVGTKAVAQKVVLLPDGEFVTLSPAGEVLEKSANADRFYRYIVEDKSGQLTTRTPAEWAALLPKSTGFAPLDPAWLKEVAAMPPDMQVNAVFTELRNRNPEFNPKSEFNTHTLDGNAVVELELDGKLTDLSPVRALSGLKKLQVRQLVDVNAVNFPLSDLSPLTGMSLTQLKLARANVTDYTPLKGMPLQSLWLHGMKVPDLSQFAGLPLEHLGLRETDVSDLTPIRELKLKSLDLFGTQVTDLSPVSGMPLEVLVTSRFVTDLTSLKGKRLTVLESYGPVTDVSTLKGMPLESLWIFDSKVTDLSPLEGMPLKQFRFDTLNLERDGKVLRSLKSLETLNDKPAKGVLKCCGAGAFTPPRPATVSRPQLSTEITSPPARVMNAMSAGADTLWRMN